MSKLSLLLIPLLFMTSCTIGWNDEKDAKTTELEKQSQDQDKELTNKVIANISKDF